MGLFFISGFYGSLGRNSSSSRLQTPVVGLIFFVSTRPTTFLNVDPESESVLFVTDRPKRDLGSGLVVGLVESR